MDPLQTAIAALRGGREDEARWFFARAQERCASAGIRQRLAEAFNEALARFRKPGERGTGDTLARIVKPVGDAIEAIKGAPCGGCGERREGMNAANPYEEGDQRSEVAAQG